LISHKDFQLNVTVKFIVISCFVVVELRFEITDDSEQQPFSSTDYLLCNSQKNESLLDCNYSKKELLQSLYLPICFHFTSSAQCCYFVSLWAPTSWLQL